MSEHKKGDPDRGDHHRRPSCRRPMGVKSADLIRKLIAAGKMVTQNQPIDFDKPPACSRPHGWKVEKVGLSSTSSSPRPTTTEDLAARRRW